MKSDSVLVEICVDSVASAVAAQNGGAQQVELCSDLAEGGITPSAGLIEQVRRRITIALQVMVRPRGSDFCYSSEEFEVMQRDLQVAKQLGADGISMGILTQDAHIDVERTFALVEMARPLPVTFHRAFDMIADPRRALSDAVQCGVTRILTSGGEQTAEKGLAEIAQSVRAADGKIRIMVCGGVRHTNVARILAATGARECHANLQSAQPSPMRFWNERLHLSTLPGQDRQRALVEEESVRQLVDAAQIAAQAPQ